MKRIYLYILPLCFLPFFVLSQEITGNLENYLEAKLEELPNDSGDDYQDPTPEERTTWTTLIKEILDGDLSGARALASQVNYQIIDYTSTSVTIDQHYYILEEKLPSNKYWGTYVFRQYPNRAYLVLQSPHAIFDTNTGLQAVYCFMRTSAGTLFLNGTHRCNHNKKSECSGTTSACGSNEMYPISDMAHNVNSIFQLTTEIIFHEVDNSIFIQLHGFAKKENDPYVIMSNGSRELPEKDYPLMLKSALLNEDNSLTFQIAHINTNWTRLLGFTNTQGRFINSVSDPCNENADLNSGRFIHIEQEKSKLRANEEAWAKLSNSINMVFPATLSTKDLQEGNFFIYPNPTSKSIKINGTGIMELKLFSIYGERLNSSKYLAPLDVIDLDISRLQNGTYLLRVHSHAGISTKSFIKSSL